MADNWSVDVTGLRVQGPSDKHQASSTKLFNPQATSIKPQAQRLKPQATSSKLADHGPFIKFYGPRTEVLCQDKTIVWMRYMIGNLVW